MLNSSEHEILIPYKYQNRIKGICSSTEHEIYPSHKCFDANNHKVCILTFMSRIAFILIRV